MAPRQKTETNRAGRGCPVARLILAACVGADTDYDCAIGAEATNPSAIATWQEAKIDQAARNKMESQRRTIMEGTQERDILYRKYYDEEVKKLGI